MAKIRYPRTLSVAAALLLAAGLTACGEDEQEGRAAPAPAQPRLLAITFAGTEPDIRVRAPASVPAGLTRIELTNELKGDRIAQLVRFDTARTAKAALKATAAWIEEGQPLPGWVHLEGGIDAAADGSTTAVTQVLPAGRYLVAEADGDKQAFTEFIVTAAQDRAATRERAPLPPASGTVTMKEYGYTASRLTARPNQPVRIDNAGREPHFIVGFPLNDDATLTDLREFIKADGETKGPPPTDVTRSFSTAIIEGGAQQVAELSLRRGRYAFVCFIPDRAGGRTHFDKGMVSEVTVR